MAVSRQFNFLGQMRVDVPHLRLVESAVAGDFDSLAGKIIAGQQAAVVAGFNISVTNAFGAQAKNLKVVVAGAALLHYGASESGTIFTVAAGTAPETLDPTVNSNVAGSFAAGATNYVGVDLIRKVSDATTDLVQFLDSDTLKETPHSVPLARTLSYRFVITTKSFASSTNIAPIATIVVDAQGNVTSITDSRKLMFRLGSGGDVPNTLNTYTAWGVNASTRKEPVNTATSTDPFTGGDKGLGSFKDWMNAVMTRMWEISGGEYWYSPTADRDVLLTRSGAVLANGDYFSWSGTNLTWQGLSFIFANSTGNTNAIANQTVSQPGMTDLAVGECLFVDVDRTQNLTGGSAIVPVKGNIASVGVGPRPGSRIVLAWRTSTGVFARGLPYPVGTIAPPATNVGLGIVKLASAYVPDAANPEVPTMDATSGGGTLAKVLGGGLTRGTTTAGNINLGTGANDNTVNIGRSGQSTVVAGALSAAGATFSVDASGNVTAASFSTAGASSAATYTATGLIKGGSFQNTGASFTVSGAGAVVALSLSCGSGAISGGSLSGTSLNVGAGGVTAGAGNYSGTVTAAAFSGPISGTTGAFTASVTTPTLQNPGGTSDLGITAGRNLNVGTDGTSNVTIGSSAKPANVPAGATDSNTNVGTSTSQNQVAGVNLMHAWAAIHVTTNTVLIAKTHGLTVSSTTLASGIIVLSLNQAMTDANYAVVANAGIAANITVSGAGTTANKPYIVAVSNLSAAGFRLTVCAENGATAITNADLTGTTDLWIFVHVAGLN